MGGGEKKEKKNQTQIMMVSRFYMIQYFFLNGFTNPLSPPKPALRLISVRSLEEAFQALRDTKRHLTLTDTNYDAGPTGKTCELTFLLRQSKTKVNKAQNWDLMGLTRLLLRKRRGPQCGEQRLGRVWQVEETRCPGRKSRVTCLTLKSI